MESRFSKHWLNHGHMFIMQQDRKLHSGSLRAHTADYVIGLGAMPSAQIEALS